jgi:hypothetical protein
LKTQKRKSVEQSNEPRHYKCPYLVNKSDKVCRRMIDEGLDGELSQFDVEHYCNGNPMNCYYYRSVQSKRETIAIS